jgi:ribonuclease III family protein
MADHDPENPTSIIKVFPPASAPMNETDIRQLGPVTLAFVGDAVHTLYVRTQLARSGKAPRQLHLDTSGQVRAQAQAMAAHQLMAGFSEEEKRIFLRGRNAKTTNIPKHAQMGEYRSATGFEALLGFLYLSGRRERLGELLEQASRLSTNDI